MYNNINTFFAFTIYIPCIQAFLEHPSQPGKYSVVLEPVCSVPVYDAKAKKELAIMDMSDNSSPVEGGRKIILLCEKITREDIKVHTRFSTRFILANILKYDVKLSERGFWNGVK